MKTDSLKQRIQTNWSPLFQAVLKPVAAVLAIALMMLLIAATVKPRAPKVPAVTPKVLMVGDSLSVGKFGEILRNYLVSTYGAENVAVYASCGSSPENWLRSEPSFVTPCGYREQTPRRSTVIDAHTHIRTPKLEDLVATYRPTILIVQLGTNWMDKLLSGNPAKEEEMRMYLDRFISVARSRSRRIIWITPPDSSHYPARVQRRVASLIKEGADRDGFSIIDSKPMTNYVVGKTGGDGVHYNAEASARWASQVIVRLKRKWELAGLY
jgi:hypothetical protein